MEPIEQIVYAIIAIASLTLIALFGHVPALRHTPIGWTHRLVLKKMPSWIMGLDRAVTGGALTGCLRDCGNYVLHEKHPIVIIFYLVLQMGGMYMFFSDAYQFLSPTHRVVSIIIASTPYITLYQAVYSDPGFVSRENHGQAMELYPYDYLNFYPGNMCRTCHLIKPARSKHCSLCRRCVSKMDHHCVWINNCVGHNNTRHFLAFLCATTITLLYAAWATSQIITRYMYEQMHASVDISRLPWAIYLKLWFSWMLELTFIGAVFLLSALCSTLSIAFTAYHLYLIYCGTTTNESAKWADWGDDIKAGEVYTATDARPIPDPNATPWPRRSNRVIIPLDGKSKDELPSEYTWRQVTSLDEIDNIYDLGFAENMRRVIWPAPLSR